MNAAATLKSQDEQGPRHGMALEEISEALRIEITRELKSQFEAEFQSIRNQYEDRFRSEARRWESERLMLIEEIRDLQLRLPGKKMADEIACTEIAIAHCGQDLEKGLLDNTTRLGDLLALRNRQAELKAYLRGLTLFTTLCEDYDQLHEVILIADHSAAIA